MFKAFIYFLILGILSSCATGKEVLNNQKNACDLVKELDKKDSLTKVEEIKYKKNMTICKNGIDACTYAIELEKKDTLTEEEKKAFKTNQSICDLSSGVTNAVFSEILLALIMGLFATLTF